VSARIRLFNLGPSPNSKKVRLALGFKGIDYEVVNVDPMDRATVVEASGQPLTPVLLDGSLIVYDSHAILRHLEANVKREPRLFSADYDEMSAIEKWEGWTRTKLGAQVGGIFGEFFSPKANPDNLRRFQEAYNTEARHLEQSLGAGGWLVGGRVSAADITAAAWVGLGLVTPPQAAGSPILAFFAEHLKLDPALATLRRWYQELNRHDAHP
jgi:glutathione S-transferase